MFNFSTIKFCLNKLVKTNKQDSFGSAQDKSFTLIELLVVIAILAILMGLIVITLNPSEMLRKSRDVKRISQLASLNNALAMFQVSKPNTSIGTANVIYISIPDSSSSCANLGLPTLPTGYSYSCSTSDNYRNTNGTGWIPVNFNALDTGSPLSTLPIDPTNTTSTGLYYTYIPGGSWELTSIFESSTYRLSGDTDKASTDGGDNYSVYEVGNDLKLNPLSDTNLVAHWKLDENTGTSITDSSGNLTASVATATTWQPGKTGSSLYFDGTAYVTTPSFALTGTVLTVTGWVKIDNYASARQTIIGEGTTSATVGYLWLYRYSNADSLYWRYADGLSSGASHAMTTFFTGYDNNWTHFTIVADYSSGSLKWYRNGLLIDTDTMTTPVFPSTNRAKAIGSYNATPAYQFQGGNLDDIRIYNKALSDAEIRAIYNASR